MYELIPIKINKSVCVLPKSIIFSKPSLRATALKVKHFHFRGPLGDNLILNINTNVFALQMNFKKKFFPANTETFHWSWTKRPCRGFRTPLLEDHCFCLPRVSLRNQPPTHCTPSGSGGADTTLNFRFGSMALAQPIRKPQALTTVVHSGWAHSQAEQVNQSLSQEFQWNC